MAHILDTPTSELLQHCNESELQHISPAPGLLARFMDGEPLRTFPDRLRHYRETALYLAKQDATADWGEFPIRQRAAALDALFLSIEPNIARAERAPELLAEIFTGDEMEQTAYDLYTLRQKVQTADRIPQSAVVPVTHREIRDTSFSTPEDYHNLRGHRLFEVDIYRPESEILAGMKKQIEAIHAELRQDDADPWEMPRSRKNSIMEDRLITWRIAKFWEMNAGLVSRAPTEEWEAFASELAKEGVLHTLIREKTYAPDRRAYEDIIDAQKIKRTEQAVEAFKRWLNLSLDEQMKRLKMLVVREIEHVEKILKAISQGHDSLKVKRINVKKKNKNGVIESTENASAERGC
ncbi:MAG: hypothetical protein RBR02_04550 [Desulfuromonadaceae bacterium]|nr:hypothetical protein [Desulfuromonadaceae bacterium]